MDLLALVGLLAMVAGMVSLIRPLHRLGIRSRRSAASVLAAGLLLSIVAGANAPAEPLATTEPSEEAPAQQAETAPLEGTGEQAQSAQEPSTGDDTDPNEPATVEDRAEGSAAEGGLQGETATSAEADQEADEENLGPRITRATVTNVVDGDTIDVKYAAGAELPATRIRMIGVDTPEVHGQTEPYGAEASAFTKEQLTGKTVWLEKDVSDTDRYGRALRYVWLTEPPAEPTENDVRQHMFNAILVLQGYAQASTYPPDVKYSNLFAQLQREAREAARGLWGLESEQSGETEDSTSETAGSGQEGNQGQNCHPSYPDVCIPPPPPDLDCGDIPYRNFRVLPPDPHRFDGRDQDGIGCEN